MRIGIVASEFPPEIGGVQSYSWHLACALAELGHDVTVFTRPGGSSERNSASFCIERSLRLRRRFDRAIVHRRRMDVWHSMNASYAWLALETAPVFVTVHGNDFLRPYHPVGRLDFGISDRFDNWLGDQLSARLMRAGLPRARHIFTNSHYTERAFLQHYPNCRGKTSVASVGIADEAFAPHVMSGPNAPAHLITVCRLSARRKNIPAILEALASLRADYSFHYTIVGEGEFRSELERMAFLLGLGERVTFTGYVCAKRKTDLLRQSDLFVLPAVATAQSYEGFGLVYLEANACGTPVLAARIAGAVEAVKEGCSGYFVEEPTARGIAVALKRFFDRDVTFEAKACQQFARQFSWRAVAEHCVAHYSDALRR